MFSLNTLSEKGQYFSNKIHIRLMSDDDIIFLMKNVYSDQLSNEFFDRRNRRHPLWKSEAEYKAFFLEFATGGELLRKFECAMEATAKYLGGRSDIWKIDDKLVTVIRNEIQCIDRLDLDEISKKVQKKDKELILKVLICLKQYADMKRLAYDFIIIKASQFNSGFGKPDFSDTNIVFPKPDGGLKVSKVGKIVASLQPKEKNRDNFFYLFYRRNIDYDDNLDCEELCKLLMREFIL